MMQSLFHLLSVFTILACSSGTQNQQSDKLIYPRFKNQVPFHATPAKTIGEIPLPTDAKRILLNPNSFGAYLRGIMLKPPGSPALIYTGEEKANQDPVYAVLELPIGKRDLHQCADGIMHLKARYHFEKKEYNAIGFHFVNGFYCDFNHWKNGYRVKIKGNNSSWYKATTPDSSESTFWKYLEIVFAFAGTLSLDKELNGTPIGKIQPGDVFIQGGSPGHAVIVADAAITREGDTCFLLAQSYMPAQELHVLHNYNNTKLDPWYSLNECQEIISTPEWTFYPEDLKSW